MPLTAYLKTENNSSKSLALGLFTNIERDVVLGNFTSGSRLTEQKICEKYHVSRTPVRECLNKLEADGLIQIIPNRGAFVNSFSDDDRRDIYVLKANMEIRAAGWAATRASKEDLDTLKEAFEFMLFYSRSKDLSKLLQIHDAFMRIIYDASHNMLIIKQLCKYRDYVNYIDPMHTYSEHTINELLSEHTEIYNGIFSRDSELAESAMRAHLENTSRRKAEREF